MLRQEGVDNIKMHPKILLKGEDIIKEYQTY